MQQRISVRGIVLHENKLLCVKLKTYQGSLRTKKEDFWCLPGGGLDAGETLLGGIEREMLEETGVMPRVGKLLYVHQFQSHDSDHVEFFFHITNSQDYLNIDLANSTHGEQEIEEIAFIDPRQNYILPTFLSTEQLPEHAAGNNPVQIIANLKAISKNYNSQTL